MRRSSSRPAADRGRAIAALLLASLSAPAIAAPAAAAAPAALASGSATEGEPLLLEVYLNGVATGKVAEFARKDGMLYAEASELRDVGLAVPASGPVRLSSLPGLTTRIDEAALKLFIDAPLNRLAPQHLTAGEQPGSRRPDRGGTGMLLNYDAVATEGSTGLSATALLDARAFSGAVSADSRFLVGGNGLVRLESTLVVTDPSHLRRYVAGDLVTGGLAWTRPVRMAGLQAETAFDMRPDLVTFPLPTVRGAIALPSSVDVLVDGIRQMSSEVAPGPFSVSRVAVPAGAATVAVQTRDSLGRVTETDVKTYSAPDLLAPGLSSFSFEAGAIRSNFGLASNDYGALGASATYRRGLRGITVEAHGEARSGLVEGGLGSALVIGDLASASAAIAVSEHEGRSGLLVHAAIERQTRDYHISLSALATTRGYSDLASAGGDPMTRLMLQASAGAFLGRWGAFDLAYVRVHSDGLPGGLLPLGQPLPEGPVRAYRVSAVTASYSRPIGARIELSATGFRDFDTHASALTINLSFSLGPRRQASAAASLARARMSTAFDVRQNGTRTGELGWDLEASTGIAEQAFAQAQYRSAYGTIGGGIDLSGAGAVGQLTASGSIAFMDHSVFAANPIRDSFAIVDAAGERGVEIMEDNQPAGRTNGAGKLILTDLRGFDSNRIAFAAADLPLNASFSSNELAVRPPAGSGVVARLGISRGNPLLIDLVDANGLPVAVGSQAYLNGAAEGSPVGYAGQLFFTNVADHNEVLVETPEGTRCRARFDRPAAKDTIPELGPVACRAPSGAAD